MTFVRIKKEHWRRVRQAVHKIENMIPLRGGSNTVNAMAMGRSSSSGGLPISSGGKQFWHALIDSSSEIGANRWAYILTATLPSKTITGPDGYQLVASTHPRYQVAARNSLEDGNTADGPLGAGAIGSQLTATGASLQAVPNGAGVWVWAERTTEGETEYVFEGMNIISVECGPDGNTQTLQRDIAIT